MKKLILISLLAIVAGSCKKYPEGPGLSLQSKAKRIEGVYHVKTFTANGINTLSYSMPGTIWTSCNYYLDYSEGASTTSYEWKFTKGGNVSTTQTIRTTTIDGPATASTCYAWYNYSDDTYTDAGTWSLVRNKEFMKIQFGSSVVEAEILELHDKQIQLRWTDAGTMYNLTLEE